MLPASSCTITHTTTIQVAACPHAPKGQPGSATAELTHPHAMVCSAACHCVFGCVLGCVTRVSRALAWDGAVFIDGLTAFGAVDGSLTRQLAGVTRQPVNPSTRQPVNQGAAFRGPPARSNIRRPGRPQSIETNERVALSRAEGAGRRAGAPLWGAAQQNTVWCAAKASACVLITLRCASLAALPPSRRLSRHSAPTLSARWRRHPSPRHWRRWPSSWLFSQGPSTDVDARMDA